MLTTVAKKSAIGAANITPSMPKNIGRKSRRGKRKIICLVSDRNTPLPGFPIDVKKLEESGWIKITKVKNIYILK